mgnify:CR=1 FL=1
MGAYIPYKILIRWEYTNTSIYTHTYPPYGAPQHLRVYFPSGDMYLMTEWYEVLP